MNRRLPMYTIAINAQRCIQALPKHRKTACSTRTFARNPLSLAPMNKDHLTDVTFESLGLSPTLLQGLREAGFTHCTPIQAETLPLLLKQQDVAGQAQTGTGKSAAFLLATMHYLMENPVEEGRYGPWAIILAPTRELALQIYKDAKLLGKHTGLFIEAVYGGTGYEAQRRELEKGIDIIVGTPGRIIDFYKQRVFDLKNIEVVVLDEADRMFDLGFINDRS